MNTEQWERLLAAVEGGCPDHAADPCGICDGDAGRVHSGSVKYARATVGRRIMNTTEAAKDERVVCSHGFASRCPVADDYSCNREVTA